MQEAENETSKQSMSETAEGTDALLAEGRKKFMCTTWLSNCHLAPLKRLHLQAWYQSILTFRARYFV